MHLSYVFILILTLLLNAAAETGTDSLKRKSRAWSFTPRFNTLNMAPVSGNIINDHVNFDISLVYTRNRFMWTMADGIDLVDQHSEMNYFLTNIRYRINVTRNLAFSPFLAFYSEHATQLIDPISDANGGMIFSYQQGPLILEAFFLFVRLTHANAMKDLINRFEIRYKLSSVLFSGFVYQNTHYFDRRRRLAFGFKATFPEFRILNIIDARTELTGSFKIREYPETKNLNGVFLSLAFPFRR